MRSKRNRPAIWPGVLVSWVVGFPGEVCLRGRILWGNVREACSPFEISWISRAGFVSWPGGVVAGSLGRGLDGEGSGRALPEAWCDSWPFVADAPGIEPGAGLAAFWAAGGGLGAGRGVRLRAGAGRSAAGAVRGLETATPGEGAGRVVGQGLPGVGAVTGSRRRRS